MNIILFGYRGSGKSTIGRKLANQLWKEFVDTDVLTCQRFGDASIAAIWEEHGEPAFRAAEVEVTREVVQRDEHVIALGGGTLMQPEAREAVKAAGNATRIYLYCQTPELHKRIAADGASSASRPNLTALGGGLEEIEAVVAERDPVYREVADKVFDVTHLNPEDAVRYIIQRCL